MKLRETGVTEFTQLISGRAPAPGGGGACGACAAVAVALGSMVGEFTVGKKKYAQHEERVLQIMNRAEGIRVRLLELIDEDAANFEPLSQAYGIPKDAPGRADELERCLFLAIKAPLEIFKLCCEVIDIQEELSRIGSVLMLSDAATGVSLARGALMGAAANVRVNTALMADRSFAQRTDKVLAEKLKVYTALADKVFYSVYDGYGE